VLCVCLTNGLCSVSVKFKFKQTMAIKPRKWCEKCRRRRWRCTFPCIHPSPCIPRPPLQVPLSLCVLRVFRLRFHLRFINIFALSIVWYFQSFSFCCCCCWICRKCVRQMLLPLPLPPPQVKKTKIKKNKEKKNCFVSFRFISFVIWIWI